ncbi:2-hydroxyacid dehydrogenase [Pontibacter akesuensis]|uniref:Glyoxylate/hydroxypyruvate reductase A n=1 Tax=Pontibacter akesuensis TaxID=388950 RepID=A0A1I7KTI7_9BACT|nr:glyoxylate/hydroxypyruvate reductase A [Pontibacter akesuensis]GHA80768.1 glyoxylate/hydroxypyruvate reductase A [Pontibacter akesuensis]SFV00634.1 glyoxylate/hydroxypyruvate reductase A [Pontibacter akesuensis]
MPITIVTQGKDLSPWVKALKKNRPDVEIRIYPDDAQAEEVEFALAWNHPLGVFKAFPNLKCISSMGAGVDHILKDTELPKGVTVTKIVDTNLTQDMGEFILALALNHIRGLAAYKVQEQQQAWQPRPYKRIADVTVGVMGVGELGAHVASQLHKVGFNVCGWARTAKELEGVAVYVGEEELNSFLAASEILVCLLPLTKETANILNKGTLQQLPKGAFVINAARGEHVVDEDLVEMINNGHLAGASLDVFREEPLPQEHVFWKHPDINITPHMASKTDPETAVLQILDNYDRLQRGEPLQNIISLEKGY